MVNVTVKRTSSDFRNIKKLSLERAEYPLITSESSSNLRLDIGDDGYDIILPTLGENKFKDVLKGFSTTSDVPYILCDYTGDDYSIDTSKMSKYDFSNIKITESGSRIPLQMDMFEYGLEYSEYLKETPDPETIKLGSALSDPAAMKLKSTSIEFASTLSRYDNVFTVADYSTIHVDKTTAENLIYKDDTMKSTAFVKTFPNASVLDSDRLAVASSFSNYPYNECVVWNEVSQKFYLYSRLLGPLPSYNYYEATIQESTDGQTWNSTGVKNVHNLSSVVFSSINNLYIGVSAVPTYSDALNSHQLKIFSSVDGLNFTLRFTSNAALQLSSQNRAAARVHAFDNGKIYISTHHAALHFLSDDGINWTEHDKQSESPAPFRPTSNIAYGENKYIASGIVSNTYVLASSPDLLNWTIVYNTDPNYEYLVSYHPSRQTFVAVTLHGNNNPQLLVSSDGLAWSSESGIINNFSSTLSLVCIQYLQPFDAIVALASKTDNSIALIFTFDCINWNVYTVATAPVWAVTDSINTIATSYYSDIQYKIGNTLTWSPLLKRIVLPETRLQWNENALSRRIVTIDIDKFIGERPFMVYINSTVTNLFNNIPPTTLDYTPLNFPHKSSYPCEEDSQGTRYPAMTLSEPLLSYSFFTPSQNFVVDSIDTPSHYSFKISGSDIILHNYNWLVKTDDPNFVNVPEFPYAFSALDFEISEDVQSEKGTGRCLIEIINLSENTPLSTDPLLARLQLKYALSLSSLVYKSKLASADIYNMFKSIEVLALHPTLKTRFTETLGISNDSVIFALQLNRPFRNKVDCYPDAIDVYLIPRNVFKVQTTTEYVFANFDRLITRTFEILLHMKTVTNDTRKRRFVTGNVSLKLTI